MGVAAVPGAGWPSVRAAVRSPAVPGALLSRAARRLGADADLVPGDRQVRLLLFCWLWHLGLFSEDECLAAVLAADGFCQDVALSGRGHASVVDGRYFVWEHRLDWLDLKTGEPVSELPTEPVTVIICQAGGLVRHYLDRVARARKE